MTNRTLRTLRTALKTTLHLGPRRVALNALYRLSIKTGRMRRLTPPYPQQDLLGPLQQLYDPDSFVFAPFLASLSSGSLAVLLGSLAADEFGSLAAEPIGSQAPELIAEADEIVSGSVRLFGGDLVPLDLTPPGPLKHWTEAEVLPPGEDIKLIWEPARFGWAYPLARAYVLTQDERYPAAFWSYLETFLEANPPNLGPNWSSAQEVALRIMAFSFAGHLFASSPCSTPERKLGLIAAIAAHAARIPPTLMYARSQNNNHLLVECAGLYTAGVILPGYPPSLYWRGLAWEEFHPALQAQVDPDGTYVQHSANYHRLALQVSLWFYAISRQQRVPFPEKSLLKAGAAARWLLERMDPPTGRMPNFGHNDGAHILPIAAGDFADYRPTAQTAAAAFLGPACLPAGPWDEMQYWLNFHPSQRPRKKYRMRLMVPETREEAGYHEPVMAPAYRASNPLLLKNGDSSASLRAARFHDRPAHADQLHVDITWAGLPVTLDPGTFRYTAAPPWQNALARTRVHNTVEIDGRDQMTPAGKFLWLDWAQAVILEQSELAITAEHNGYARLGLTHQRSLASVSDGWEITDRVLPLKPDAPQPHLIRLHWLLPDVPWEMQNDAFRFLFPIGEVRLDIRANAPFSLQVVRAGEILQGSGEPDATLGWYSPTYNHLIPALSITAHLTAQTAVFTSRFHFTAAPGVK